MVRSFIIIVIITILLYCSWYCYNVYDSGIRIAHLFSVSKIQI